MQSAKTHLGGFLVEYILDLIHDLGPYAFGFFGWFITGIDDLLIFSHIYRSARNRSQRTEAIAGMLSMVVIMILIVVTVGQLFTFLHGFSWIGGFLPLFLAIKTWRGSADNTDPKPGTLYWMAFRGFGLNCLDDIAYNTAIVGQATFSYAVQYLGGVFFGAIMMVGVVILAHLAFIDRLRDVPRIRAVVMFLVAGYILFPGWLMIKTWLF